MSDVILSKNRKIKIKNNYRLFGALMLIVYGGEAYGMDNGTSVFSCMKKVTTWIKQNPQKTVGALGTLGVVVAGGYYCFEYEKKLKSSLGKRMLDIEKNKTDFESVRSGVKDIVDGANNAQDKMNSKFNTLEDNNGKFLDAFKTFGTSFDESLDRVGSSVQKIGRDSSFQLLGQEFDKLVSDMGSKLGSKLKK